MAEREMQYGDLTIAYTTDYTWLYNDRGSGGALDGSFWRPRAPPGFKPVSDYVRLGHNDPNSPASPAASLVVKNGTAVQFPIDYELVWTDQNSGGKYDGSIWRPVPPNGFRALGYVCNSGYGKPALDTIYCVREDLCVEGRVDFIWDDRGSGSKFDVSTWRTSFDAGNFISQRERIILAPNAFVAWNRYGRAPQPGDISSGIWILSLPQRIETFPKPALPKLETPDPPPPMSKPQRVSMSIVPFTALNDKYYSSLKQQVANTPFYSVHRKVAYEKLDYYNNDGSTDETRTVSIKTGISSEYSQTVTRQTGWKFTNEAGFSFEGVGEMKTSMELSHTFGYETRSSSAWSVETTITDNITFGKNAATAIWGLRDIIEVRRADNTVVSSMIVASEGRNTFKSELPIPKK